MEPLSGLDAAFLALETPTSRLHVAGILVLEPADDGSGGTNPPAETSSRYEAIRDVVASRLERVPRLHRRAVRVPLDLHRPVWVDDPEIDIDAHVRRATVAPPGRRRELDALVGELLSRPLPIDRPLWEMVVVEGLAGGRTAVVARLHHAILDGVSGASAMAAFLDLSPEDADRATPSGSPAEIDAGPLPSPLDMCRYAVASVVRQPEEVLAALRRSADAIVELAHQNRDLAEAGLSPPPALFSAPRTSLNGNLTAERRMATLAVPLVDLELVRRLHEPGAEGEGSGGATVNDVILCAVGGALARYLDARREDVDRPLVALVPVSTRGPASVQPGGRAHVGNYVSGMLVPLATNTRDPVERLRAVASASRVAKRQEERAGGDFLESIARVIPPVVLSTVMRGVGLFSLFDRLPPPANVVVSSVVVPDVSLWWAGSRVSATFPAGPVADGIGLNVTSMTYMGTVHFGVVSCPRLMPDVDGFVTMLDDAVAELVSAALRFGHGIGVEVGRAQEPVEGREVLELPVSGYPAGERPR